MMNVKKKKFILDNLIKFKKKISNKTAIKKYFYFLHLLVFL